MTIVESATSPLITSCRLVIDNLDTLKNSRIVESSLLELKTSIHSLVNTVNSNLLLEFPISIVDESIDDIRFEIGGTYLPDLKFTEMKIFVTDTLEQAERLSDVYLCLNAIRVLVNYANIVVFSRTGSFSSNQTKKISNYVTQSILYFDSIYYNKYNLVS